MAARFLAETTVSLIEAYIKANISAALADVRALRTDAKVTTEVPKQYFRYRFPQAYETPCVFTICDSMDMRNSAAGANYIAALAKVFVSVLVEDRMKDNLVTKTFRYQAALQKLLHETALTTPGLEVKLVLKVVHMTFSPEFSKTKDPSAPQSAFQKEVALEIDVEHHENL